MKAVGSLPRFLRRKNQSQHKPTISAVSSSLRFGQRKLRKATRAWAVIRGRTASNSWRYLSIVRMGCPCWCCEESLARVTLALAAGTVKLESEANNEGECLLA